MMNWLLQKIWLPLYGRWVLFYMQKPRSYRYAGLQVQIPPGVFHPGLFFSTPAFIDFLQKIDFQGKKVLDMGTGSGLLALFAAQKGGLVTAVDIHPLAVQTTRENAQLNGLHLEVLESDLFQGISPEQVFDFILVNPPYYAAQPKDLQQRAFFAGEQLEYFQAFFQQLGKHRHTGTHTWMILSTDCDLPQILQIAEIAGYAGTIVDQPVKWGKQLLIADFRD